MKKFILLLLLSPVILAQAQTPTGKSPWTSAPVKSSVPTAPVNPGAPVVNNVGPQLGVPNGMGVPISNGGPGNPMYPTAIPPSMATPGAVPPPEMVQDNVSVVYLGKVNGKIFTRTKDNKNYALVSPSTYKRIPKLEASTSAPLDGNLGNSMSGANGPGFNGNTNGLPSAVGGPNRSPINR